MGLGRDELAAVRGELFATLIFSFARPPHGPVFSTRPMLPLSDALGLSLGCPFARTLRAVRPRWARPSSVGLSVLPVWVVFALV